MHRLYQKSEIWFSIVWIIVYVVGTSAFDALSSNIGTEKLFSFIFLVALSAVAIIWMKKSSLFKKYGICKPVSDARSFLYYIPLIAIMSCNAWFGLTFNMGALETALYIGSMLCVGFLEEFIFRGLLFRAMSKDGLKAAVVVSSLTFGIGHMVNLINGSGADLIPTLLQVVYAAAFGFLCVVMFYRGGSLWPCIIAHGAVNSLSVFAKEAPSHLADIASSAVLAVLAFAYAAVLLKTLPKKAEF